LSSQLPGKPGVKAHNLGCDLPSISLGISAKEARAMVKKKAAVFLVAEGGHFSAHPDGVSTPKSGWVLTGDPLPENPAGWFCYRPASTWYLIEGLSGLSVGQAATITNAVDAFVSHPGRLADWQNAVAKRVAVAELPSKPDAG
jgi:hypothetical protein